MNEIFKDKIEKILPLVSRPSRYLDGEWNAVPKDADENKTSVCLCFPDMYEVGVSNLGIEILYHIVNSFPGWVAERCYCPETDMEQELLAHGIPLCALGSGRAVKSFDIVGFTLQHELCYTNVLHMLHLAGIPKKSSERTRDFPLIIGGGPCVANPEPVASFFDAFVLGDGEEVIVEIMTWITESKKRGITDKNEILAGLSAMQGVYVPSFYDVHYSTEGRIQSVTPVNTHIPKTVKKRTVNLEKAFYPEKPLVPFMHAVHDRLNLEIARGCQHQCRFCQASQIHRPLRQRSVEKLLDIAEKALPATGFEELSLSSLSSSDYTRIEELVEKLVERYASQRISISLPSLRCNMRALKLAQHTRGVKKSSLTLAPEAGTPRMRAIINKNMDGENFLPVFKTAYESGWKHIKLYFMYGLPYERQEDVTGIINLIREVKRNIKQLNLNITISPFVPKSHTPFQWCGQEDLKTLERKHSELLKHIPANVRAHSLKASVLEGMLSRGDRRLSEVILKAYELGCRFDQWRERLQYEKWEQACAETGIDQHFYTTRERAKDEIFPWDHLLFTVSKQQLYAQYVEASRIASTGEDVPAHYIKEKDLKLKSEPPGVITAWNSSVRSVQRVRLRFSRSGAVRFLSQLEQITAFRRMFRRTQLPLAYTHGYHPQPKISFGPAIAVSYSSDAEYVDVELTERVALDHIRTLIEKQLPEGFKLLTIKRIPVFFPSLDSSLNQVAYHITGIWPHRTEDKIVDFLKNNECWIEKIKNDKKESINLSSVVKKIALHNGSLELVMDYGPKKNVKPGLILQKVFGISEKDVASFHIHKVGLYISKQNRRPFEP